MVLAVVIGAFWAAVVAAPGWGYPQTPWAIGIVAAFAVAAACTFVLGMLGRRGGLATLLTLVLLISAPVAGVVAASGQSPADLVAHTWTPTRAGESRSLAVADANLDLSALTLAACTHTLVATTTTSVSSPPQAKPSKPPTASGSNAP